jgi:hypothetical protein
MRFSRVGNRGLGLGALAHDLADFHRRAAATATYEFWTGLRRPAGNARSSRTLHFFCVLRPDFRHFCTLLTHCVGLFSDNYLKKRYHLAVEELDHQGVRGGIFSPVCPFKRRTRAHRGEQGQVTPCDRRRALIRRQNPLRTQRLYNQRARSGITHEISSMTDRVIEGLKLRQARTSRAMLIRNSGPYCSDGCAQPMRTSPHAKGAARCSHATRSRQVAQPTKIMSGRVPSRLILARLRPTVREKTSARHQAIKQLRLARLIAAC